MIRRHACEVYVAQNFEIKILREVYSRYKFLLDEKYKNKY
jgi:hypothetical protein